MLHAVAEVRRTGKENFVKTPKFTDSHRYPKPYRSAADSRRAGYLAERMKEYAMPKDFAAPQTHGKTRVAAEVSGPSAVAAPDDPIAECFRVTA